MTASRVATGSSGGLAGGGGTTDLLRQGRYHPAYLPHAVRAVAAADCASLPCFYSTREALYRIERDRSHPVRLTHQSNRCHTLVSDNRRLYLLDRTRLECCDHSGARLWHYSCSSFAMRTRLALYGDDALLLTTSGARNAVLCLCRKSGRLLWSVELPGMPSALAAAPERELYDIYFLDLKGTRPQLRGQRMRQNRTLDQIGLPKGVTAVRGYAHGASYLEGQRVHLHDFETGHLGSFSLAGQLRAESWNPALNSYSWIEMAEGRTYLTQAHYPEASGKGRRPRCNSSFISCDTPATA